MRRFTAMATAKMRAKRKSRRRCFTRVRLAGSEDIRVDSIDADDRRCLPSLLAAFVDHVHAKSQESICSRSKPSCAPCRMWRMATVRLLSGPTIKPIEPIVLRMVYEADKAVTVVGLGGITRAEDAVEFMLAGATAVQ